MIKGTISGGVEPGASYSFALKKPGGTVIGTAEIVSNDGLSMDKKRTNHGHGRAHGKRLGAMSASWGTTPLALWRIWGHIRMAHFGEIRMAAALPRGRQCGIIFA